MKTSFRIQSLVELYECISPQEQVMVDILRHVVMDNLKDMCKEKLSFNVPFFYGHKGICIIWPASIPRGGIKDGVLFGFWYGHLLEDKNRYLERGSTKKVYYKIYHSPDEIDIDKLSPILKQALMIDKGWRK